MARSGFSRFLVAAVIGCLSIVSAGYAAVSESIYVIARAAKDWALGGLKLAARADGDGFARPAVLFVQARAFVLRLAKRERPQLSGSWRMCPSI